MDKAKRSRRSNVRSTAWFWNETLTSFRTNLCPARRNRNRNWMRKWTNEFRHLSFHATTNTQPKCTLLCPTGNGSWCGRARGTNQCDKEWDQKSTVLHLSVRFEFSFIRLRISNYLFNFICIFNSRIHGMKNQPSGRVNRWMNEWTNEQTNKRTNEWREQV